MIILIVPKFSYKSVASNSIGVAAKACDNGQPVGIY